MLSFVVPAYNEEGVLGATLDRLLESARAAGEPFEVIVANDGSTDATREMALSKGVRVVDVRLRQIAGTRNAGARAAKGDVLVFVDADTLLPLATLREALAALEAGAVGGGAFVTFDQRPSLTQRFLMVIFTAVYMRLCRWAAGCFIFARREAFEAAGGFDERYYASEEIHLSRALKRQGRFVVVRSPVITSARKLRMHGLWTTVRVLLRLFLSGPKAFRRREGLDLWYGGEREGGTPGDGVGPPPVQN
jgi:glycosyltransferase involved in cell wall biosynthesis